MSESDVKSLSAAVKFYLDTKLYGRSDYNVSKDFVYPPEHDTINRKGQDWYVFDIDVSSKIKKIKHNNPISVKVDNPYYDHSVKDNINFNDDIFSNDSKDNLITLYSLIFNNFDFVFKFYDDNDNEIDSLDIEILKDAVVSTQITYIKYKFKNLQTNSIIDFSNKPFSKIKIFLNDDFISANMPYFEKKFLYSTQELCLDSIEIMNQHKVIPVVLYDENDQIIENVELTYRKKKISYSSYNYYNFDYSGYNVGSLIATIKDKSIKAVYAAKKIEFLLGLDDTINFDQIQYKKDNLVYNNALSGLNEYLYLGTEELVPSSYQYIEQEDSFKILSIFELEGILKDTSSSSPELVYQKFFLKDPRAIETNFLELGKYSYNIDLDTSLISTRFTDIVVDNISTNNGQNHLEIPKMKLIPNSSESYVRLTNNNQILTSIKDSHNHSYGFNYTWRLNTLDITLIDLDQNLTNETLTLTFKSNEMRVNKEDLNIKANKESHPFITLYENDKEIQSSFFYAHDQKTGESVGLYFNFTPDPSASYYFKIIDYQNIYDFDVIETNYFSKNADFEISSYLNYDGEMPLNNMFVNLSKDGELIESRFTQGKYGSNTNLNYAIDNYTVSGINVFQNQTYDVQIKTLYKYKDFMAFTTLCQDQCKMNYDNKSEFKYGFIFPYVNFYGNFVDSSNHTLKEISGLFDKCPSSALYVKPKVSGWNIFNASLLKENYGSNNDSDYIYLNAGSYNYLVASKAFQYSNLSIKLENVNDSNFTYETSAKFLSDNSFYAEAINYHQYQNECDFEFRESYLSYDNETLDNFVRNYSIYPGTYNIKLYMNDNLIKDYGNFDITKENEATGDFYGIKLKWPFVNFTGKIVNKANGEIIHKHGIKLRLLNNETFKFIDFNYVYQNGGFHPMTSIPNKCVEGFTAFKSENNSYIYKSGGWTNGFKFIFQGFKVTPSVFLDENGKYYDYDSLWAAPSVPSGHYTVQLLDQTDSIISTYFNDLNLSSDIYDLELDFPLCKFTGYLNSNGTRIYDDNFKVLMENLDNPELSALFEFKNKNCAEVARKNYFEFNSFGREYDELNLGYGYLGANLNNCKFIKEGDDRNSDGVYLGSTYCTSGLFPGNYKIRVFYKEKEIEVLNGSNILINKEKEAAGLLNNYEVQIANVYGSISGYVINDQFGIPLQTNIGLRMSLLDENFDGNFADDFTDTSKEISKNFTTNNFTFDNLITLGYDKITLGAYSVNNMAIQYLTSGDFKIQPNDIKNLNNESIFYPSGHVSGSPNADIVNLVKMTYSNGCGQSIIHVPYWYYPLYRKYQYVDEHDGQYYYVKYVSYYDDINREQFQSSSYTFVPTDPYIDYKLTYENTDFNELKNADYNIVGIPFSTSNTSLQKGHLFKSGHYTFTMKYNRYNDIKLYEENYVLSSFNMSIDEFNVNGEIKDPLSAVTLNMNLMIWRDDVNAYQILSGYYGLTENRNYDRLSIYLSSKLNDEDTLSSYYHYKESLTPYVDYQYQIRKFPFNQTFVNLKDNIMGTNYYQCKFILPELFIDEQFQLNIKYGGKDDANNIKFKGLYKADISKNFSFEDPNMLSGFSLKSIVNTYVVPTDETLFENLSNDLLNEIGEVRFNKVYRFEDVNDFSDINHELTTPLNELLNNNYPVRTLSSYLSSSIEDLFVNKVEFDSTSSIIKFNPRSLGITNPNPAPIKYFSLVVDELTMNIIAYIHFEGETNYHDFALYGNILTLKIYDKDGNLEKTLYNKGKCFLIPNIKSGAHTFKIYMYGVEIHNELKYIYRPDNIDLFISKNNFVNPYISGELSFNGNKPIDITHVTVYNNDLSTFFYSGNINGESGKDLNGNLDYSNKRCIGVEGSYDRYSTNSYEYFHNDNFTTIFTTSNKVTSQYYHKYQNPQTLYEDDNINMTFDRYRLYDLLPGNYTIKYYTCPASINYFEFTNALSTDLNKSDTSIFTIISSNLNDLIDNHTEFYIKESDVKFAYKHFNDEPGDISGFVDYSKLTVMKIKLFLDDEFYGTFFTNSESVQQYYPAYKRLPFNAQWHLSNNEENNWINFNFECEKTTYEDEPAYKIKILDTWIPQNQEGHIRNLSYRQLIVSFAEYEGEQTLNITRGMQQLPTFDFSNMYSQILHLEIHYFKNGTAYYGFDGIFETHIFDSNNVELPVNISNSWFTAESNDNPINHTQINLTYSGLALGRYLIKVKDTQLNEIIFSEYVDVNNTLNCYGFNPDLYTMNLTFKDASLNNKKCSSNMFFRLFKDRVYTTCKSQQNASGTASFSNLENGNYELIIHEQNEDGDRWDDVASGENVFNKYRLNGQYEPISSFIINNANLTQDVILPYQFFKINLKIYDPKADAFTSLPEGMKLLLTRKSINEEYSLTSNQYVKSGPYKISYISINMNTVYSNSLQIFYQDQDISSSKTFTIYQNVEFINNVCITLQEHQGSNGATTTSNCINKNIEIYDENGNIFLTTDPTDSSGKVNLSLPNMKWKFKVGNSDLSELYPILNDNNKNIVLVLNSNNITFG